MRMSSLSMRRSFLPVKIRRFLLRAFASVAKRHPEMKLLLAGTGALEEECKALVKSLHMETQIQFLGYVDRMGELYPLCDVSVTSSRIEGLPFNVMESMACGLPVVASDIKGHRELVLPGKTGFLFPSGDQEALEQQLEAVYQLARPIGSYRHNALLHIQRYRLDRVLPDNIKIYTDVIGPDKEKIAASLKTSCYFFPFALSQLCTRMALIIHLFKMVVQ